jgi:hypothetical protein
MLVFEGTNSVWRMVDMVNSRSTGNRLPREGTAVAGVSNIIAHHSAYQNHACQNVAVPRKVAVLVDSVCSRVID